MNRTQPVDIRVSARGSYNREDIYRYLWTVRNGQGIITKSILDLATDMGMARQRLSCIITDFVTMGHIRRHGRSTLEIRFNPDHLDWGEKFEARSNELRKRHQTKERRAKSDPSYVEGANNEETN